MDTYTIYYIANGKAVLIDIKALGFSHIADVLQSKIGYVPDVQWTRKLNAPKYDTGINNTDRHKR